MTRPRKPHLIDTPDPYRHCDHEDYCHSHQMKLMNHIPAGWACPYPCKHDTRTYTSTPAPEPKVKIKTLSLCNYCNQENCGDKEDCLDHISFIRDQHEKYAQAAKSERERVLKEQGLKCWGHYQMNSKRCLKCSIAEMCYTKREDAESLRAQPEER